MPAAVQARFADEERNRACGVATHKQVNVVIDTAKQRGMLVVMRAGLWSCGVLFVALGGCDSPGKVRGPSQATAQASSTRVRQQPDPGTVAQPGTENTAPVAAGSQSAQPGTPAQPSAATVGPTQPGWPGQPVNSSTPTGQPTQPGTQPTQPVQPGTQPGAPPPYLGGQLSELVASANRKMMHDDGKGCLADLDKVTALDPSLAKSLLIQRAQCEMLIGHCQAGKKVIADYYVREMNMSPDRAEQMAESMGSMRCRGGDMTHRDRLLAALFDLSDGAYMNTRSAKFCLDRIELISKLVPKVKPRDALDSQVISGPTAMFHTGAACLAKAGDCQAAYRVYDQYFPPEAKKNLTDPATRNKIIGDSFRSSIVLCKEAKLRAP